MAPGSSQGQGQKDAGIDPAAVLTSWSGEIARDTSSCLEMIYLDHNYLSYQHGQDSHQFDTSDAA